MKDTKKSGVLRRLMVTASAIMMLGVSAVFSPANAGKEDNTLTVAWDRSIPSLDYYYISTPEMFSLGREIWDSLIERDPVTHEYKPSLATSWAWIDDLTLELKLREDVKFHNDEPFDADDVVYTLNLVSDPKSKVTSAVYVRWIKNAEKIDKYTVRIHLKEPFPAALEFLAGPVLIYPNEYYERVGSEGMSLHPVGTGPYQVANVDLGKEIVLESGNGLGPRGKANISRVVIRFIPEKATQMALLLAGKVDWIPNVPVDEVSKFDGVPGLATVGGEIMRFVYFFFDVTGRAGKSPLQQVEVRRAIAHAINREEIANVLYGGGAKPAKAPCFWEQFGCYQDAPQYEYDPEKAKSLLAAAGYPNGFDTKLDTYMPTQLSDVIAGYLGAVGVRTKVETLQFQPWYKKLTDGASPISMQGWASFRINDSSAALATIINWSGISDYYGDAELKEQLNIGDTSTDPEVRKAAYEKAILRMMDQMYILPLNSMSVYYAYREGLEFSTYKDEVLRYYLYKWN
ncbi:MAG: ABC transporter substrate-binding protein [Rhizobiaceae bacterium]|nr:ABC transporter substrate-binding protein [Rhizobiaceae bacterium]